MYATFLNLIMRNNKPLSTPDIIKLFDFLDLWTPAAKQWIANYFRREAIPPPNTSVESVEALKRYLATIYANPNSNPSDARLLARKMGNAWRAWERRRNSSEVNLTVAIDKGVSKKLTHMCRGHSNKADMITRLIEGNYELYLAEKKAQKKKRDSEKRIKESDIQRARLDKILKNGNESPSIPEQQTKEILQQLRELKASVSELYELISSANKNELTSESKNVKNLVGELVGINQYSEDKKP